MKYFIGIIMAVLVVSGCSKEGQPGITDIVCSVTSTQTENALRVKISVAFHKDCQWYITYWPTEDESEPRSTAEQKSVNCSGEKVLMFLYPDTDYSFRINVNTAKGTISTSEMVFHTSALPAEVPEYTVVKSDGNWTSDGFILQWAATNPGFITFCDLDGRVVWYEKFDMAVRHVDFDPVRGEIAALTGFKYGVNSQKFQRVCSRIEVIDLEGNRLAKIDTGEGNIMYPHHDIRIMPDGNLLVLNNVVRNFDLTAVGGGKDVPVYGEGFTVMDRESGILRTWDVFGEIDFSRDKYLEPLKYDYDLLHANSVTWDDNGDFYMTLNRYSELWKIDGKSGDVLYKLSSYGNVALDGAYPQGGLHSAVVVEPDRILCYNNGGAEMQSRAVLFNVNAVEKTATYDLDVPIPQEWSSKDRSNVDLIEGSKMLMFNSTLARACIFTDLEGNIKRIVSRTGISYRAHYYSKDVLYNIK